MAVICWSHLVLSALNLATISLPLEGVSLASTTFIHMGWGSGRGFFSTITALPSSKKSSQAWSMRR